MLPGDAPTSPLPLTDRIAIALDQLRTARTSGQPHEEFAWEENLNTLLDGYPRTAAS